MKHERYRVQVVDAEYYKRIVSCQDACPAKTDARGYVNAIADGLYEQAYVIARQPNPFASTCAHICVAPCEAACRRGARDRPIAIRALKRFVTQRYGAEAGPEGIEGRLQGMGPGNSNTLDSAASLDRRAAPQGRWRVAVVGSGPAGLTAAYDLARLGHGVTLFESLPWAGGMVRTAIPEYRLPRAVIDAEVESLPAQGLEVRAGQALGRDFSLEQLEEGYQAIFLAIGAERTRKLSRPDQGIFAEGDVVGGTAAVIDAVAAGHRAARLIDAYLRKARPRVLTRARMFPVDPARYLRPGWLEREWRGPRLGAPQGDQGGIEQVYTEEEARYQASRCLQCHIQTVFHGDLCILCGGCVDICPNNCLKLVRLDHMEGGPELRAAVQARYGATLEAFQEGGRSLHLLEQGAAMIKDETQCTRCALCYQRCPVGAITMEAFWFEEILTYAYPGTRSS